MPRTVERWLETFMCKQYAYLFEDYGFKTLQQVCQLQPSTLHSMGIPPEHCDKILENVSVLRQSLVGSVGPGCSYPEHPYENQMASHNQSNNYNYHPPTPYTSVSPSSQQYGTHSGQIHANMPYSNSQSYSSNQSNPYGQQIYSNRMHQSQVSWDSGPPPHDMRTYNQSPRNMIGSPPPPPVMRSPPPNSGLGITHYRQMMIGNMAEQSSHSWPQSQIPSPGMMHSPRTTPSPGMGPPAVSMASPSLPNRSPAHKPFSPPPFSPHGPPPPAHQQQPVANYDYQCNQSMSPSSVNQGRSMASPSSHGSGNGNTNSGVSGGGADPLQSLQKMVMLEGQQPSNMFPSNTGDSANQQIQKPVPSFSSIEQLVGKEGQPHSESSSPSSCYSQNYKWNKNSSAEGESPQQSSSSTETQSVACENQGQNISSCDSQSDSKENSKTSTAENAPSNASSPSSKDCGSSKEVEPQDQRTCDLATETVLNSVNISNGDKDVDIEENSSLERTSICESDSKCSLSPSRIGRAKWKPASLNSNSVNTDNTDDENSEKQLHNKLLHSPNGKRTLPLETTLSNGPVEENNEDRETNAAKLQKTSVPRGGRKQSGGYSRKNKDDLVINDTSPTTRRRSGSLEQGNLSENHLDSRPRMLRGRRAFSGTTKIESEILCSESGENPFSSSVEGAKCDFVLENKKDSIILSKCRTSNGRQAKSPIYVDVETDGTEREMVISPRRIKSPRRERSPGASNSKIIKTEKTSCCYKSPHSEVHSSPISPKPSTSLSKISLKLNLKAIDKSPDNVDIKLENKLSGSDLKNRMSDAIPIVVISQEDNLNASSNLSSSQESESTPRKKRGRPLGSKNKPKAAGSEKVKGKKGQKGQKSASKEEDMENSRKRKKMEKPEVGKRKKSDAVVEMKFRGPYIHIEGTREKPLSVSVINSANKDEEHDSKGFRKKKLLSRDISHSSHIACVNMIKRKMAKIGFTSTLSSKYDAVTKDKTWVCELCHKGSHYMGLGDLFGPYFEERVFVDAATKEEPSEESPSPEKQETADQSFRKVRAKRKRSELVEEFFKSTMAKKSKRKESTKDGAPCEEPEVTPPSVTPTEKQMTVVTPTHREVWIHEDCIVWSHGVYLVGNKVFGLEEATRIASDMLCSKCKEAGATLGCLNKGCTEQYHYVCAIERGCQLNEENFSLLCLKHKKKPRQGT